MAQDKEGWCGILPCFESRLQDLETLDTGLGGFRRNQHEKSLNKQYILVPKIFDFLLLSGRKKTRIFNAEKLHN